MLRYYCIFVCLQLCFCLEQLDDTYNDTPASSSWKEKKETTRKSKLVQFDMFNFMKRNDDVVDDALEDRNIGKIYDDYASLERDPNVSGIDNVDDSSILYDDIANIDEQLKSHKDIKMTSSAWVKEPNSGEKSEYLSVKNPVSEKNEGTSVNVEPKTCAFRNMKLPFFSYDEKGNTAKHQHKRKYFCFNCKKKINKPMINKSGDAKISDGNYFKDMFKTDKRNKRSHHLCPKCIRGLLNNLKKKTTKKVNHQSKLTQRVVTTSEKRKNEHLHKITNAPYAVTDSLNRDYYTGIVREKRSVEDAERERRLKELAEVERKIESIRVTSPMFT